MRSHVYTAVLLLAVLKDACGARVLGLFPHTGRSHQMVFEPLLKRLAERGHRVTVASFFPLKHPPTNYTDVSFQGVADIGIETVDLSSFEGPEIFVKIPLAGRFMKSLMEFHVLADMATGICRKLVDWPPLKEALQKDYDVVLLENFNSDCMAGLLHVYKIKAPVVSLLSSTLMPWSAERMSVMDNPSFVPNLSRDYVPPLTFWQRMENTFLSVYYKYWFRFMVQTKEQDIIEKRYGRIPDLDELGKNISLMLVNTHHSLNGRKISPPGIIEVGGMHLDPTRKTVPEEALNSVRCRKLEADYQVNYKVSSDAATLIIMVKLHLRILGLFPHTGRSHQMVFEPLLQKLAERGHHVTVASFFPLKNPPANYTDVSFQGLSNIGIETMDLTWFENPTIAMKLPLVGNLMKALIAIDPLAGMAVDICGKILDYAPFTDVLRKEYDVVLVENFSSDCMIGLLHVFNITAPVVSLLSCTLMPWSAERMGVMDNPAYEPTVSSPFKSPMPFRERVENSIFNLYLNYWMRNEVQLKEQSVIEQRYGKIPDLGELARHRSSLMLVNTHHSLNGRKLFPPGIVEVGGMHLDLTRKHIPEYIEKFLNESEHGVVLFSFGSLIKTASMPKYKEDILIRSLSKLKQRVIWKYEDSPEEGNLTGNILRVRWLPQYELLQHKKVIAFLAHGGLLGMTEAISAGKPMVVVPFFGDQPTNAIAAEAAGFGKMVSYMDLSEEALDAALQSVLSAETRMKARQMSKIWSDRQNSPLDTAVYWTERVIRWGHAAPLHSEARNMPFYQLALLDVAAAYLAIIMSIVLAIWFIIHKILRLFVKEGKKKIH